MASLSGQKGRVFDDQRMSTNAVLPATVWPIDDREKWSILYVNDQRPDRRVHQRDYSVVGVWTCREDEGQGAASAPGTLLERSSPVVPDLSPQRLLKRLRQRNSVSCVDGSLSRDWYLDSTSKAGVTSKQLLQSGVGLFRQADNTSPCSLHVSHSTVLIPRKASFVLKEDARGRW